jgi:hypothetical protein
LITIGYQATPVHAWWATGHTIVASRATKLLPQSWSNFFGFYAATVNETALYPDTVYPALDPNEDPRHFIDLEVWNPNKPETGTLPFAVAQYTTEMSQAIKARDWNLMFLDAGRVAHYVADIHQPYHSTVNYDPRNMSGTGLHGVLDASMENHVNEFKLVDPNDVGKLQPVENITAFMFYIAWQSHSFLSTINHTLIDERKSWSPELTKIIENRTNTAIISVARVWYTAIFNAGQEPPQIPSPNRLSISIETPPQQVDPGKSFSLVFTVSDSLGIRSVSNPKVTVGDTILRVYPVSSLQIPSGKYQAIIPSDTMTQFAGSSMTLNLLAEQAGFEGATAQVQIQVSLIQSTTTPSQVSLIQINTAVILEIVAAIVAILGLGFIVRRRMRAR